jgi:hypothetical protein
MRKAIAQLDSEQREALLYLTDVGISLFGAGLVVSTLKFISELAG